jgi:hypothetical protein
MSQLGQLLQIGARRKLLDVRFDPFATELECFSESTRGANNGRERLQQILAPEATESVFFE